MRRGRRLQEAVAVLNTSFPDDNCSSICVRKKNRKNMCGTESQLPLRRSSLNLLTITISWRSEKKRALAVEVVKTSFQLPIYKFLSCNANFTIVNSGLIHSGAYVTLKLFTQRYGRIKEDLSFSLGVQRLIAVWALLPWTKDDTGR